MKRSPQQLRFCLTCGATLDAYGLCAKCSRTICDDCARDGEWPECIPATGMSGQRCDNFVAVPS